MTAMQERMGQRPLNDLPLQGLRVMVVEDDAIILMDLEMTLTAAGARIVGPCRTVDEALATAAREPFDVAILDLRLGRTETAAPVAEALVEMGKPFLFYTGQAESDPALQPWIGHRILGKPARPQVLVATVAETARRGAARRS